MKWLARRISPVSRGQGGIGLLETLIAVAIIGVIGVVYIRAVDTNTRVTGQLDEQTVAKTLITATIEAIRDEPYAIDYDTVAAGIPTPNQYTISVTTDCTNDANDPLSFADCTGSETWQRIYVSVTREGRPALRICTYRAKS